MKREARIKLKKSPNKIVVKETAVIKRVAENKLRSGLLTPKEFIKIISSLDK